MESGHQSKRVGLMDTSPLWESFKGRPIFCATLKIGKKRTGHASGHCPGTEPAPKSRHQSEPVAPTVSSPLRESFKDSPIFCATLKIGKKRTGHAAGHCPGV